MPRLHGRPELGSGDGIRAFSPQLVPPCLAFLFLPSLFIPDSLFQNTHGCLQASGMLLLVLTPSMGQLLYNNNPPFIVPLSHAVPWARHIICLIQEDAKAWFSLFYGKPVEDSEGEGTFPESYSWRAQKQAPGASICPTSPRSLHPTPWPGFPMTSSSMQVHNLFWFCFKNS